MERILVINPGSTSSKIAVYDGEHQAFLENINHPVEEIGVYPTTNTDRGKAAAVFPRFPL